MQTTAYFPGLTRHSTRPPTRCAGGFPPRRSLRRRVGFNVRQLVNSHANLAILFAVVGVFVLAATLGVSGHASDFVVGAMLFVCGVTAIVFARSLTKAQRRLSRVPVFPSRWENVRPFTIILWGSGVALVGLLRLFGL